MNAIVRVAIQFIKNCFRSRLCLPWIVFLVAVPVLLYVLYVPSYQRVQRTEYYLKVDRDDILLEGVKLNPSVVREAILKKESPDRSTDSQITGTVSDPDCQKNGAKCTTAKQQSHVTNTTILATPGNPSHSHFTPQTVSDLPHSSYESQSNSLPIKGVLPRILLIYDNFSVDSAKRLKVFLQSQRIDFDLYSSTKNRIPPPLSKLSTETDEVIGRYALILCADIGILLNRLGQAERRLFYDYSRAFNVSVIALKRTAFDHLRGYTEAKFTYGRYLVYPVKGGSMSHIKVDDKRQWLFTKGGITVTRIPKSAHWQVFLATGSTQSVNDKLKNDVPLSNERTPNHQSHLSLQFVQKRIHDTSLLGPSVLVRLNYALNYSNGTRVSRRTSPLALVDRDLIPGTVTVLIGMDIRFWLTKLILMDVIKSYSNPPLLRVGNERWVMVDIDDIFLAPQGLRTTASDVEALIAAQKKFQTLIPGFKFNLGFCGYYYDKGLESEQLGNQRLVQNKDTFNWFGHVYNHYQPHNCSEEQLVDYMTKNRQFASEHGIPITNNSYSVTPHHSGIYPIHQPLYNAWRRVWNVSMTTTEEYPHLYPFQLKRGFIHQGVMVVPRQTCQLYTHTYSNATFKGGREELVNGARGGAVFNTLLYNPVSIFMTHVTNYAVDRLALVLFDKLFNFVRDWTNIQLVSGPPLTLGREYFDIFPEDKMPFWTSPCLDKRHLEIWSPGKNCSCLPSLLVIGPQKSGTTALYTFLRIHPNIASNHQTQDHFEEIQFFSNITLYSRGIEWYMDQFPMPSESQIIFEKSATYLNNPLAPARASSLLPKVKLIAILHDPVKRAYSWYQHMRAHNDPTALNHTFSEVIRATPQSSSNKKLLSLRDHCLSPGRYHIHLSKWLRYYSYRQLYLIDGGELVADPVTVMARLQEFLQVEKRMNYSKILSYSERKRFHCLSVHGKFHCLGAGKGRQYPPMETADVAYLEDFYRRDNLLLRELLKKFSYQLPTWLTMA